MSDPAIHLDDLDRLARLLPDNTPPHGLAAIARAAVEIRPVGEPITLQPSVETDDGALTEHLAWMRGQAAAGTDEANDRADDVGNSDATAAAPPVETEKPAAVMPAAEIQPVGAASDNLRAQAWTEDESRRLMAARAAGKTFAEIAEQLGRTRKACEVRFRKLRAAELAGGERQAAPTPKPAKAAAAAIFPQRSGGSSLAAALAELDDSFEPVDDRLLVEQRYLGVAFPVIANELGCDEATAKARWRAILKCGVDNAGGIVTAHGWRHLRAAVALRAAEAEG